MKKTSLEFNKDLTRQKLLSLRGKQSTNQQHDKSMLITKNISISKTFKNAKHIAFYHAVRGEANPSTLAHKEEDAKQFYLPVVANNKDEGLIFVPINKNTQYRNNQFSIPEPIFNKEDLISADKLDLVIMPLLGFDQFGNRLGMGGGYYDRSFSFKRGGSKKPILFGFAYDFQEVSIIPNEPWDIPLDRLATETRVLIFNKEL